MTNERLNRSNDFQETTKACNRYHLALNKCVFNTSNGIVSENASIQ